MGKGGTQESETGEVRKVSLLAVGSHGGLEHEKALGSQWPGDVARSVAHSP